ncbi:MAG: DUF3617 domain-containing protein [Novosphingobium sp.]
MTMKPLLPTAAAALALLTLSGCGKSDTGPKTMDQAKQEAAKLDRPKPGQYSQKMTVTKFEVPGAPPQMAEQMKAAMGKAQEHSFCLTEEMAGKGFQDMFDKVGNDGECKYDRFDVSGGKLDAVLQCENKTEGKGVITLAGTVSETGSDVTVSIEQQGGHAPMANAKIAMHLVSQRTGDCTGGEKILGK